MVSPSATRFMINFRRVTGDVSTRLVMGARRQVWGLSVGEEEPPLPADTQHPSSNPAFQTVKCQTRLTLGDFAVRAQIIETRWEFELTAMLDDHHTRLGNQL